MANFRADLRYAIRMWGKQPFLMAAVILAIAVGIGATVAIFSVVDAVLLKPLAYKNQQELVVIWDNFLRLNMEDLPTVSAETLDYARLNHVFENVAAFRYVEFNLSAHGQGTRSLGTRVSANLFSMLGTRALFGRTLLPSDDQGTTMPVAVLSYGLWKSMTGGNPGIIGQTITMNDTPYAVVGVMPENFHFPTEGARFPVASDVWVPAQLSPEEMTDRDIHNWFVVARLKPGVSLAQAQIDMDNVAGQLDRTYPNYRGPKGADGGWKITVRPLAGEVVGDVWIPLTLLSVAGGFVFMIACANIASLLMARVTDRQLEIGVRSALGATRARIVGQLLTEGLLLSLVGGLLGLALANIIIRTLTASYATAIPRLTETHMDVRVLSFAVVIVLLAAVVFALAPALFLSSSNVGHSLTQSGSRVATAGRYRRVARDMLVGFEIAMAVVLLIDAGLLLRSFQNILAVAPGFNALNSIAFTVSLAANRYPTAKEWNGYYLQALNRIQSIPGVKIASVSSALPLNDGPQAPFSIEGRSYDPTQMPPVVRFQSTGPAYLRALGIRLTQGRDLSEEDIQGEKPVVMVNQALAAQFFPHEYPLGRRIKIGAPTAPGAWLTIVGIADNARSSGLDSPVRPEMYIPFTQRPDATMDFVVNTDGDAKQLLPSIRFQLQSLDQQQPIFNVRVMEDLVARALAPRRFSMLLTAVLAGIALSLAIVGLFGMIYYMVAQRTRELAVRMALGARTGQIQQMILASGLKLTAIATGVGLVIAFVSHRIIASMLFDVTATDPVTYFLCGVLILSLALLATYLPVRKITKIHPHAALRYE